MRYPNAAKGLGLIFIGQILSIAGILLAWVPLVGVLLILASPVVQLLGIYRAGDDDESYRGALVFAVLVLVVGLVSGFLGEGFFDSLLSMVSSILGFLMMFTVCNTTSNLLHSVGEERLSLQGGTVIKIYAACTGVSILCQILGVIPIINILALVAAILAGIVQIVGYVLYLMFLNGSSKAL